MGKVISKATRPIRNFNIENRVQKVIQTEKPRPAPRHPTTVAAYESHAKDHPEFFHEHNTKNLKLDENLRKIRVNSIGDNPEIEAKSSRHMPEDRSKAISWEYGIPEPDVIREGCITLRQALAFISQHHLNPKEFSAESIAREHKLNLTDVENVLKYFQALHMHIPKAMLEKNPKLLSAAQGLESQPSLAHEDMMKLGDSSNIRSTPSAGTS
ncbi:hypothetical protein C0Q70_11312 [Pomacea canaliculata]|uniref:NADH dehydrogenase [ubiquinone] 1 alpha subcomplex assembly factor 4 n=1 Tax=Pomacea canaliculata TaxID=400727 RepID=A0A2T7P5N5_POMCA|nr:protein NDUFAF4 homolog [Pomacea canaliculata]PVD28718.1 hypothetical protein C0Q70_11312 [Pomacea canaliculata]